MEKNAETDQAFTEVFGTEINGFGRNGRLVACIIMEDDEASMNAINDTSTNSTPSMERRKELSRLMKNS
jgi:glyceraldehyde-3-phosphate dehydrogenase/erythrose-4-phosphate dehydrogenase